MTNLIVQQLESQLPVTASEFDAVSTDEKITFAKEAAFALQVLNNNSYLGGIAQRNPQSLKDAIMNVAAIGTTLNPAEKKAYLVPRKGIVCLDLSYRGLADLAVESGACEWVDAKIVYEGDEYEGAGLGQLPKHTPKNPFAKNKQIQGVYAAAKRKDGSFAVTEMSIDEVEAIKARSESAKKGSGPWKTDYKEMVLKTPMKNVVKRLQGTNKRIDNAIAMLNAQGEGIDFHSEQKQRPRDINCTADIQAEINSLLEQNGVSFADIPQHVFTDRMVESVEDLTQFEAGKLCNILKVRLSKMEQQ